MFTKELNIIKNEILKREKRPSTKILANGNDIIIFERTWENLVRIKFSPIFIRFLERKLNIKKNCFIFMTVADFMEIIFP